MANRKYKDFMGFIPEHINFFSSFSTWKPHTKINRTFSSQAFLNESDLLNLKEITEKIPIYKINSYSDKYYFKSYLGEFFHRNEFSYDLIIDIDDPEASGKDTLSYSIIKNTLYQSLDSFINDPDIDKYYSTWSHSGSNLVTENKTTEKSGSMTIDNEKDVITWLFKEINDFLNLKGKFPNSSLTSEFNIYSHISKEECLEELEKVVNKRSIKSGMRKIQVSFGSIDYTISTILKGSGYSNSQRDWAIFLRDYINRYKKEGKKLGANLSILMEANAIQNINLNGPSKEVGIQLMENAPRMIEVFINFYKNEDESMLNYLMFKLSQQDINA